VTEAAQAPAPPELEISPPDDKWRADFHGLLHIGALSGSFEWLGHRIVLHTLRSDETLLIASLIKEWESTIGSTTAYATAMCALAVDQIDSTPLPSPLGDDGTPDQWARERFAYAQRWFPPTIDMIYTQYLALEKRVQEVLAEMGKASARGAGLNGNSGEPNPEGS